MPAKKVKGKGKGKGNGRRKKDKGKELPASVPASVLVSSDVYNHRRLKAKGKGSSVPFLLRWDRDVPYQHVSRRALDAVITDVFNRFVKLGCADISEALSTYVEALVGSGEARVYALYNFFHACYTYHTAASRAGAQAELDYLADAADDDDDGEGKKLSKLATFMANLASCGYKVSDLNIRLEGVGPECYLVSKGPTGEPYGAVPDFLRTSEEKIYNKELDYEVVSTLIKALFLQKAHFEKSAKREMSMTRFFGSYLAKKFVREPRLVVDWAYNVVYWADHYRGSPQETDPTAPCALFLDTLYQETVHLALAGIEAESYAAPEPAPGPVPAPESGLESDAEPESQPASDAASDAGDGQALLAGSPSSTLRKSNTERAMEVAKDVFSIITVAEKEETERLAAEAAAAAAAALAEPEQVVLEVPEEQVAELRETCQLGEVEAVQAVLRRMHTALDAAAQAQGTVSETSHSMGEILRGAVNRADATTGLTALHAAARSGSPDIVHQLLVIGARVSAAALNGFTPLHVAAYHGFDDVVRLLLEAGADPNAIDLDGLTALHLAAGRSQLTVAVFLDTSSAWYPSLDVNCTTHAGWTPLFMAALAGHAPVVELLLSAGADRGVKSQMGRTALDYGARFDEVKELLEQPTGNE
ncbi:ankyrin [Thecamonas trahens ATCC 50062]|uniref:Ankyrin n=1 Tax=Thecamonas trahens ATCC 50062 TaxID=461836 RepID=A0A0L0D1L2_THETB|nr:ankyrin [Thecamonas trahens ATCC 50062]KNC46132.1 ankyrin [Thecamonas trahens ATCC 50062]|eukprot:XP_013763109.1 ankyrin [Thecamonas trahens ATCC 50062]